MLLDLSFAHCIKAVSMIHYTTRISLLIITFQVKIYTIINSNLVLENKVYNSIKYLR